MEQSSCSFVKTNKEWICERCGRRVPINDKYHYEPSARCRIPANYKSAIKKNPKQNGFGACLSKIIKKFGISYEPISTTNSYLKILDTKSKKWCRENTGEILKLMKKEAMYYRVPYSENAFRATIRLAIMRMT
jgi:hypothetical protein